MATESIALAASAFVLELIDAALGMGYGTALVPLLLVAGFDPLNVVPAVIVSQLLGNFLASISHHKLGNVDFSWRSIDTRTALVLGLSGLLAPALASAVAVSIPKFYIKLYISLVVASAGLSIIISRRARTRPSPAKTLVLALVAGFNKGLTGGGYGPIVTSGQILSGADEKSAIAITSFAEGITCTTAAVSYAAYGSIDLSLALSLAVGAALAAPVAAYAVKRARGEWLRAGVGLACLGLGLATLAKTLL